MADPQPTERTPHLGGLFDGREEWAPSPPEGKQTALASGLVVLDANVLLHLYRFGPEARTELIEALSLVGDRLFVPAQAATEFLKNRLSVAIDMRQELSDGATRASENLQELGEVLRALGRSRGLSQQQQESLTRILKRAETQVRRLLNEAVADRAWAEQPSNSDPILPRVVTLLTGKVGNGYSDEEIGPIKSEAKRRIDAKIPPGWKDAKKDDPTGDYILWTQILGEGAVRKVPILLTSDDAKDDWLLRVRGRTVGPLPELTREAKDKAGVAFYMSDVAGFLHLAREVLQATISQETIDEASRPTPRSESPSNAERVVRNAMLRWLSTAYEKDNESDTDRVLRDYITPTFRLSKEEQINLGLHRYLFGSQPPPPSDLRRYLLTLEQRRDQPGGSTEDDASQNGDDSEGQSPDESRDDS